MKIAVLASGGVDSSVALALLKEQGHEVTAYYLRIWLEDEMSFLGECPWADDMEYVRLTCEQLDVPYRVIDLQEEYHSIVVSYALSELLAGRTPSPDIMCNKHIKFGKFLDGITGYDKIASGHYAQIVEIEDKYYLKQAPDKVKDQTYFLTYLSQEQLSKLLFPIGSFNKSEVRRLALKYELPTSLRKDSQGICFLGKIKYSDFVEFNLGEKRGDIINIDTGETIGTHRGYWFHTIGQRQGLGLSGGPWYVAKKDISNNIVFISKDKNYHNVPRNKFIADNINWIPNVPNNTDLQVKIRHGANKYDCKIELLSSKKASVTLADNDQGIAPGQFAIFYDGDFCIGGGVIALE